MRSRLWNVCVIGTTAYWISVTVARHLSAILKRLLWIATAFNCHVKGTHYINAIYQTFFTISTMQARNSLKSPRQCGNRSKWQDLCGNVMRSTIVRLVVWANHRKHEIQIKIAKFESPDAVLTVLNIKRNISLDALPLWLEDETGKYDYMQILYESNFSYSPVSGSDTRLPFCRRSIGVSLKTWQLIQKAECYHLFRVSRYPIRETDLYDGAPCDLKNEESGIVISSRSNSFT